MLVYLNGANSAASAHWKRSISRKWAPPTSMPLSAIRPKSSSTSGAQPNGHVQSPARTMTAVEKHMIDTDVSCPAILRVVRSRKAPARLAPRGNRAAHCTASAPGRSITTTPANPTRTALQRRQPTCSPSIGDARAVTNSGPAKVMARASANGRKLIPVMNKKPLVKAKPARRDWLRNEWTRIRPKPPARQAISITGRNTKRPRMNINWPTG